MKTLVIEADNAKQYTNDILAVFAHFICNKYGIRLQRIVNNETCIGKGSADVHFASGMRHVDRYIEVNELDFVTPQ